MSDEFRRVVKSFRQHRSARIRKKYYPNKDAFEIQTLHLDIRYIPTYGRIVITFLSWCLFLAIEKSTLN
jgi:hypothetical protein